LPEFHESSEVHVLQYSYRPGFPATPATRPHDQNWVDYDPIVDRPPIRWPGNARVALWLCPSILDYEFMPPEDRWLNAWARTAPPDVLGYCRQEFGNRVGFWRLLEVFDRYNLRATAVANVEALKLYPAIVDAIVERKWDIVGHGMSNTRFIYDYDEQTERAYYREMLETVEALTGVRMQGMGGPGPQSGTENTPDLLAEAGFTYHADWFMDDQPFPLRVRSGRLIALPYSVEMNDVSGLATTEADAFFEYARRQFDCLYREGAQSGRVMCVVLHPPLIGQPQRIGYLERWLDYVSSFSDVWHATGAEIAQYYMTHYYDSALRRLDRPRSSI
jgi:allantoinase